MIDPLERYDQLNDQYRKGTLALLSSKWFLACRTCISVAFDEDFSKEISDQDLNAALLTCIRTLTRRNDSLIPGHGRPPQARVSLMRSICVDNGYLFSTMHNRRDQVAWRVTPDARRAFDAVDTLANEAKKGFTSARIEMLLDRIEQTEIDFTSAGKERAEMIQRQIKRLEHERNECLTKPTRPLSEADAKDRLDQLHMLMRDLPTDVESVAYRLMGHVSTLRDQLNEKTMTLAEMLRQFDTKTFDALATSDEGRSYSDALRIMTSDEMDLIISRLEALETADIVGSDVPRGYLSRAWDDLLRAIDHVQSTNREGSSEVMRASQKTMARGARTSTATRAQALSALSANPGIASKIALEVPWQYPMLAWDNRLVFVPESDMSMSGMGEVARPDPDDVDHERMTILAGPMMHVRLREILRATADKDEETTLSLSEIVNTLPPTSRRLVEWVGLIDLLSDHGITHKEQASWHLVDSEGNECVWTGADLKATRAELIGLSKNV